MYWANMTVSHSRVYYTNYVGQQGNQSIYIYSSSNCEDKKLKTLETNNQAFYPHFI
jgi:hypothetical protein